MHDPLVEQTRAQVTEDLHYRDGISQIAASTFIFIALLLAMRGTSSTFVIFIPIIPGIAETMRKRFTYPRVGYARIRQNKKDTHAILWVLIALVIGAGVAFFSRGRLRFSGIHLPPVYYLMSFSVAVPVLLLSFFLFSGYRQRIPYMIALVLAAMAAVVLLRPQRQLIFIIALSFTALSILIGILRLRAFTRYYPVLKDE